MGRIRISRVLCTSALIGLLFQSAVRAQEEKLGEVNFPISCSASAQTQFNRALAMLHSFFFPETVKAFTAITRQEPSCAMAYWGVAISQRPNPLVAPFPAELMKNGWEAIEAGRAAGAKTQREKDWIEALAVFFKDYDKIDLRTRTLLYEAAMARLTTNYPDDNEAAIFYALALNEAVDLSDKTYAKQFKAASILRAIEAKLPNHPGIPHYIIHSYDFAAICQQGLPAARRYADLAPTAPHALHMPSHTFSMLGMWDESIAANIKTIAASRDYAAKNKLDGIYAAVPHSYDFMQYAYLQLGQDGKARALMAEVGAISKVFRPILGSETGLAAVPARYMLEHEVIRVRDARVYSIKLVLRGVVLARRDRLYVRCDGLVPHSQHREGVRGHVKRMRRGRRELRVAPRRRQTLLANGCEVVAVDDVVRYARMVGQLCFDGLQDGGRLELFGVSLVAEVHCLVERERIENGRLIVVRIIGGQPRHRCFVGQRAGAQIDLVVILEEDSQRLDPVLLALGLCAGRASRFDRLPAVPHQLRWERSDQRIGTLADGNAPICHGT